MNILRENIVDIGAKNLLNSMTYRKSDYESQIDVMISNRPDKISSSKQIDDMGSDHSALILNWKINIKQCEEKYIRTRDFKKIINIDMNEVIMNHSEYEKIFSTKGSNNIARIVKKTNNY